MQVVGLGSAAAVAFACTTDRTTKDAVYPTETNHMNAYLEITLKVQPSNREAAGAVYQKYRQPFLDQIEGAKSKQLLIRDDDVQVLHGFASVASAKGYLTSALFNDDVVRELGPLLDAEPDVRIYASA